MAKKSNKKTIITVTIILAVLAIAYFIYKQIEKKRKAEAISGALDTVTDTAGGLIEGAVEATSNVFTAISNGVLNAGSAIGEALGEAYDVASCGCNSTYINQLDEVSLDYPESNLNGCGWKVKEFQKFLNEYHGSNVVTEDCKYGPNTLEWHLAYLQCDEDNECMNATFEPGPDNEFTILPHCCDPVAQNYAGLPLNEDYCNNGLCTYQGVEGETLTYYQYYGVPALGEGQHFYGPTI